MRVADTYRWTHPETILVASDLSDLDHLMPFALDQAGHTGAHLLLLHVLSTTAMFTADATGMPYYDASGAVAVSEHMMHPWCEAAQRAGLHCEAVVREGRATEQIVAAVRQFHADLLLLGTRSRGKLGKLLIGSVAEQVLRSVNLPVMTVGPEAHLPVERGGEGVVLHATTLRETSRPSAALACRAAAARQAKLVMLHVLPPPAEMGHAGNADEAEAAARLEMRILAEQASGDCRLEVEPAVVHGNPSIEILATAAERKASLIVLGATHRTAFENLTRDRTVHRVLAHARCPVLTVREPQAMPEETAAPATAGAKAFSTIR